jgi:hypothetical protein
MLGPNQHTLAEASQAYEARISHSARIRAIRHERHDEAVPVNHDSHRLITVRRLAAAGLAGFVLTAAIAAGGLESVSAAPNHASGGGATLIR